MPIFIPFLSLVIAIFMPGCSGNQTRFPYAVDITNEQAGRIAPETSFDASQIARLMPGFDVVPYTAVADGVTLKVLRITRHGTPVMTLTPAMNGEHIAAVTVESPEITAEGRFHIGSRFETIFDSRTTCILEHPPSGRELLCRAPGSTRIFYRFTLPAPARELPPVDALRSLIVASIVWSNDA